MCLRGKDEERFAEGCQCTSCAALRHEKGDRYAGSALEHWIVSETEASPAGPIQLGRLLCKLRPKLYIRFARFVLQGFEMHLLDLRLAVCAFAAACFLGCSNSAAPPSAPAAQKSAPAIPNAPITSTTNVMGVYGGTMVPFHGNVNVEILLDKKNGSAHVFFSPLDKDKYKDLKFVAKVGEGEVEEYVLKDESFCWELKDEKMMAQFAKGLAGKVMLMAVKKDTGETVTMLRYLDLPMK
jgi:hypothetical protein